MFEERCFDRPHYIYFLGKFPLHLSIHTLSLEDFNSHFLTTVCTFVSVWLKNLVDQKIKIQSKKMSNEYETYRSPYDPEATLHSNFSCWGSISQTSVPSLGIFKWSVSHFSGVCSVTSRDDAIWFGHDWFCKATKTTWKTRN